MLSDDPPPPSSPGASVEEILADLDGNAELARPIGMALDRADAIFKEDRSEIAIMTVDIKNTIRKETGRELRCQEIIANVCSTVPENAHDTTMSYSDTAAGWVTRLEENR